MEVYKVSVSRYQLVRKLPQGDPFWRDFNSGFKNIVIASDMLMQAVYDGRAITTWHSNGWRSSENYQCGQHIGLDFDSENEASTLAHLVKDKFILRYGAFVHTTISHTPEKPRARAIFLLDQPIMQAKNYALAAAALLWLFGTADRQCKDAVRFFYGSPKCDFEFPNQVLPLEVVKKLIADYQASGIVEKHRASHKDFNAPASQQEVADALRVIPPWQISYDEWVQVLMGIHQAFGEAGYALAENWADGKKGEVDQKWKSFDQTGNTAGVVTVATVFGIAKRFGWQKLLVQ